MVLYCCLLGCDALDGVEQQPEEVTLAAIEAPDEQPEVAAVVNDREITHGEVDRRLDQLGELYRHSQRPFDDAVRADKREKVLQRLIDRELLREYLDARDIDVASATVDRKLEQRIDTQFGSTEGFHRFLDAQQMSVGDFRRRVWEEAALKKAIAAENGDEVIDDEQLRKHYDRIANRRPAGARVQVSTITVDLRDEADDVLRDRARELLIGQLDDADQPDVLDDFDRRLLEDLDLSATIDPGKPRWLHPHQLRPATARMLFSKEYDSPPSAPIVETRDGFRVYWIHERREAGIRGFDEVEDLLRDRAQRSQLAERRGELLEKLRSDASISIESDDPMPVEK